MNLPTEYHTTVVVIIIVLLHTTASIKKHIHSRFE
jgi:hypothetical protein